MNFATAVQTVLGKYAVFSGRARRSEYWWFFLFNAIVSAIAYGVDAAIGAPILQVIVTLGLLLPGLAVGVRRLHDTGRSGWWILIALVPFVGAIVLLIFTCLDSNAGPNQYGPSPKELTAGGGYPPPPPPPGYGPPQPGYGPPQR